MNLYLISLLTIMLVMVVLPTTFVMAQNDLSSAESETEKETTDENIENEEKPSDDLTKEPERKEISPEEKDADSDEERRIKEHTREERIKEFIRQASEKFDVRQLETANELVVRPLPVDPEEKTHVIFSGQTKGWAVFGGIAQESSIMLKGEAFKADNMIWKIHSNANIIIGNNEANVELNGVARGHTVMLHGTTHTDDGQIKLFLRGYFASTEIDNRYALAFTHAGYHNLDTNERFPFMQIGYVDLIA